MAEHIVKPKRFTKEWFSYIWHYYKVHFLCGLAVVVLLFITLAEIMNSIDYDIHMNYIATDMMAAETEERFVETVEHNIEDVTGDDEVHASLTQINFTPEAMQNGNQIMALENKLMTVFASSEQMFYLFDEMMLRDVLSISATEGIFLSVSEWCTEDVAEERLYVYENEACAVKLSDSVMLSQLGIDASGMYVAVRMNYEAEDEKLNKIMENCVTLANTLIKS